MLIFKADQPIAGNALLRAIRDRSGVRVHDCYQCGKCSAGCPVVSWMDYTPNQIVRMVQSDHSGSRVEA